MYNVNVRWIYKWQTSTLSTSKVFESLNCKNTLYFRTEVVVVRASTAGLLKPVSNAGSQKNRPNWTPQTSLKSPGWPTPLICSPNLGRQLRRRGRASTLDRARALAGGYERQLRFRCDAACHPRPQRRHRCRHFRPACGSVRAAQRRRPSVGLLHLRPLLHAGSCGF